nr:MAG TPA: hypothetical protein [Caudoviricetes sp.]
MNMTEKQLEQTEPMDERTEELAAAELDIFNQIKSFGENFKDMSREDFLKGIDAIIFKDALYQLKFRLPRVKFEDSIFEATPEKIENIIGNQGYVATQGIDNKWKVTVFLGDDVVIIRDRNKVNALLRAVITRHTETVYKRTDLLVTCRDTYMKVNGLSAEQNPYKPTQAELEGIKKAFEVVEKINLDEFAKNLKKDLEEKQAEFEKRIAEIDGHVH